MKTLKMAFALLYLLILIVNSAIAMPIQQKKKTTSSKEVSHLYPKSEQKLNFIQKLILKKAQKKAKKTSSEKRYRKMAVWSLLLGLLAHPICYSMFFLGIIYEPLVYLAVSSWMVFLAMVLTSALIGTIAAIRTNNKKTRNIAIAGIASALVSLIIFIMRTLYVFNNTQF